jgi:hypothetical protein
MTSNVDLSVQQIQQDFQALIAYVTGPETRTATAYTVELTLFRRLVALGAALLRVFFQTRAAERPAGPVHAPDGTPLGYHDRRFITYYSVFGKVRFARHYFTAVGQEGLCPLDADLSLPARCYSNLLQEWGTYGATDASYHESQAARARILGIRASWGYAHPGDRGGPGRLGNDGRRRGGGRGSLLRAARQHGGARGGWAAPGGAGRWQGRADGPTALRGTAGTPGQGAETDQEEGGRGDQPLYHRALCAHAAGGGGGAAAGPRPSPGHGTPSDAAGQRTAGHPRRQGGGPTPPGRGRSSARGGTSRNGSR